MELISRSIRLKRETGDLRGIAFAIYGRGKVSMYNGEFEAAEKDFQAALASHKKFGEKFGQCMAQYKTCKLWVQTGQREKAKKLLSETIKFSEEHKALVISIKSNYFMYELYKEDGNIEKALYFLEVHNALKDTIANSQTLKVIENYETAAKIKASEKQARLKLEKAQMAAEKKQAEQGALMKQEFLSAMSHEIRTPLNAVTSIISLLEERSSSKDQKLLTSLRFSSKNLLRIIDDILDFTKLESNKMTLEKHPVDFVKLIENIRQTYAEMAREKGLALTVEVADNLSSCYLLDETKFFQILGNLLSNAIKYTDSGQVILKVSLLKRENKRDTLRFIVKDTGVGIPEKELSRLFESFYMPASVTTRSSGGTGLGLTIVEKLVALHGGNIKVESTLGTGSSFYFDIPLKQSVKPLKPKVELFREKLRNKSVILVEDNEINAMVMRQLLEKYSVSVTRAKNGVEAIALTKSNKVDCILMDIHMPEMNGFEAVKMIRKKENPNNRTPIFALTADIDAINHKLYKDYFDGFLRKPVQLERLYSALLHASETAGETLRKEDEIIAQ